MTRIFIKENRIEKPGSLGVLGISKFISSTGSTVEEKMKYPLYLNTCYAIEFSSTTKIPEWGNQDVRIGFEEDGVFTTEGCRFIDGHQTRLLLIK